MLTRSELSDIRKHRDKGESISHIARRMGRDRKTVRKYLQSETKQPVYGPRAPRPQKIDPFRQYIQMRMAQQPKITALQLLDEIRQRGYQGGRTLVTSFVAQLRPRERMTGGSGPVIGQGAPGWKGGGPPGKRGPGAGRGNGPPAGRPTKGGPAVASRPPQAPERKAGVALASPGAGAGNDRRAARR